MNGTLDGVDLNNLLSRSLLKTSPPGTFQEVTGHLHVTGAVTFANSLTVYTVNGKHFTSHLRNVSAKDGRNVLLILLPFDVSLLCSLLFFLFFSSLFHFFLPKVVPRDYTGVIRGTKTFLGPVTVRGNLDAVSVNGRD